MWTAENTCSHQSPKLSSTGPSQYLNGGLLGNTGDCKQPSTIKNVSFKNYEKFIRCKKKKKVNPCVEIFGIH